MDSADTTAAARWRSTQTRAKCFEEGERDIAKPVSSQTFSDSSLNNQSTTAAARQLSIPLVPRLLPYNARLATQRRTHKRLSQPTSLSPCESKPLRQTTTDQRPHSTRHPRPTPSNSRLLNLAPTTTTSQRTPPPSRRRRRMPRLRHRTPPRRHPPRNPRAILRQQPLLHPALAPGSNPNTA